MEKSTASILMLIEEERQRQHEIWGVQNHNPFEWFSILSEEVGEVAKELNECPRQYGLPLMSSHAEERYVEELIQVAAVAVAMIENIEYGSA